jgi:hypothetical protein
MKGVTVALSSIDRTEFLLNPAVERVTTHTPRLTAGAAEDGTYEFVGVPPGTYLMTAWVPGMVGSKKTTLTTFYPGTSERSDAVLITVGMATLHEGFDFVVRTE